MDNPELQLAVSFIEYTKENIFLTGRAGTGKTTFLQKLKANSPKRIVVTAPTGVAAINAGGVTLHSFFQLPFGIHIPNLQRDSSLETTKYSKAKVDIINTLDLLVIDEISMVRADTLDAIDAVIRQFRDKTKPFGGIQVLMIGDLQQLAPVVPSNELEFLKQYYDSPYFFDSKALKESNYITIELQHIYRQNDRHFIDLLNSLRGTAFNSNVLSELNKRYIPNFQFKEEDGYIFLTSHNYKSKNINEYKLKQIAAPSYTFDAVINGDFPDYSYPTDASLQLKLGAQVMFIKNDSSPSKRFYNGKIGMITHIDKDTIEVTPIGDNAPINVDPLEWKNLKYDIDPQTKAITEMETGSFTQYPLKTAWAITIHKSQGLTFEKTIIDAADSFTHGQVYVALSRCKTLEGIVLSSPLKLQSVVSDRKVNQFVDKFAENRPTEGQLLKHKNEYYAELLIKMFDFSELERIFNGINRFVRQTIYEFLPDLVDKWKEKILFAEQDIFFVSKKFQRELQINITQNNDGHEGSLYFDSTEAESNTKERIAKGCQYFIDKIESILEELLIESNVKLADEELYEAWLEGLKMANEFVNVKKTLLISTKENGFSVSNYLETNAKAVLEKPKLPKLKTPLAASYSPAGTINTPHLRLYNELNKWRTAEATTRHTPSFYIAHNKSLLAICNSLPQTKEELLAIPGIGKKFIEKYSDHILTIIGNYLDSISTEE